MISRKEYEILKKLENNIPVHSKDNFDEIYSLQRDGYVYLQDNKYHLNGEWRRVIEEYEVFLTNEIRKDETLKKSRNANILSVIAIIVPSLISVGALIVSILAYFKN